MPETASKEPPNVLLFGPETEMWAINCERCGLLFGPAAAVLQVAHPRIAQGVFDHSDFRSDALGRLRRTLRSTNRIAFGTRDEAEAMRARLAAVHGQVQGKVHQGIAGGSRYSAFEPELLNWVLATLVMAAVGGFEFVYGRLPLSRKEVFYRDMCRFGSYFGVDEGAMPAGWKAFADYYRDMVEGDLLGSHPLCGEMARSVVYPADNVLVRLLGSVTAFLPLETLPGRVRDRLGLSSTRLSRAQMKLARTLLPRVFPSLPANLRFYPEYIEAGRLRSGPAASHPSGHESRQRSNMKTACTSSTNARTESPSV